MSKKFTRALLILREEILIFMVLRELVPRALTHAYFLQLISSHQFFNVRLDSISVCPGDFVNITHRDPSVLFGNLNDILRQETLVSKLEL